MSDRGVSVTLDYIMMLMIATVLLAGIVAISGSLIDGQVDRGVESELSTTGESLAADIQDVERLYNASQDNTSITLARELPGHVGGHSYTIAVNETGEEIILRAADPDVSVSVPVASNWLNETDSPVTGGSVVIEAEDGSIEVNTP